MCEPHDRLRKYRAKTKKLLCSSWNSYIIDQKQFTLRSIEQSTQHVEIKLLNNFWSHKKSTPSRAWMLKSRGPILHVTSSETRSVCVKQALNTRRWLVNGMVTWHVSYKITTLPDRPCTSGCRMSLDLSNFLRIF